MRITDIVYNASNNELVCAKTLMNTCVVLTDSTPDRQWCVSHGSLSLDCKKRANLTPEEEDFKQKVIKEN